VDLLRQNAENLIDQGKGLFVPELFGQGGRALQVAEHDRYLSALPFDPALLGQYLLS
jgi:hypothetical protein